VRVMSLRLWDKEKKEGSYALRRVSKIPETPGRKEGTSAQQLCVNTHKVFVNFGCAGREGRVPVIMATMAAEGGIRSKGIAPVNTYDNPKG
jgi:hypothetical protein